MLKKGEKNNKRKDESVAGCDNANRIETTPGRVYTTVKHFADRDVDTGKCSSAVWPIMVL